MVDTIFAYRLHPYLSRLYTSAGSVRRLTHLSQQNLRRSVPQSHNVAGVNLTAWLNGSPEALSFPHSKPSAASGTAELSRSLPRQGASGWLETPGGPRKSGTSHEIWFRIQHTFERKNVEFLSNKIHALRAASTSDIIWPPCIYAKARFGVWGHGGSHDVSDRILCQRRIARQRS